MRRPLHIHIHKTAGTSVRNSLGLEGDPIHVTAAELRTHVGEEEWIAGVPFAVVRNPWVRFVSFYLYLGRQDRAAGPLGEWVAANLSFGTWLRRLMAGEVAPGYAFQPRWASTQTSWLAPDVTVYHYESFSKVGWPDLLNRLQVPYRALSRDNASAVRVDYRTMYTDELREGVARAYAIDIDTFGYKFEEIR